MDKSESAVVTLVKRVAWVSVVYTVMISSLMMIVPMVMPTPKPLLSINRSRINHLARIRPPPSELQWWFWEN
jgi:hypothetical protein